MGEKLYGARMGCSYDLTKMVSTPDGKGRMRVKVGRRHVNFQIEVDIDKLIRQKGERAALNKKLTSVLCFGAVVRERARRL